MTDRSDLTCEAAGGLLPGSDFSPVWRAIASSWLSMKTWVKAWLFALNGIFLAALCFWPEPLPVWSLVGYAACGPLLIGMMVRQRGFTRLLGLAHLIPWVPLLAYLVLRLAGDAARPRVRAEDSPALFAYTVILTAALAVCLSFDLVDVIRWVRRERYVLGSPEAVRAGASKPSPLALPDPANRTDKER